MSNREPTPAERARVAVGFEALKRELAANSTGLDMRRPHPLPRDRIMPAEVSDELAAIIREQEMDAAE